MVTGTIFLMMELALLEVTLFKILVITASLVKLIPSQVS